jgi:hypothetical protein
VVAAVDSVEDVGDGLRQRRRVERLHHVVERSDIERAASLSQACQRTDENG